MGLPVNSCIQSPPHVHTHKHTHTRTHTHTHRRESTSLADIFYGHISGMDALARGLRNVAALKEAALLEGLIKERYASWYAKGGVGEKIRGGKVRRGRGGGWRGGGCILSFLKRGLTQRRACAGASTWGEAPCCGARRRCPRCNDANTGCRGLGAPPPTPQIGFEDLEKWALANPDPVGTVGSGSQELAEIYLDMAMK